MLLSSEASVLDILDFFRLGMFASLAVSGVRRLYMAHAPKAARPAPALRLDDANGLSEKMKDYDVI
jgi:hypothetical protein